MESLGPVVATVFLPDVASACASARAARNAGADRVEVRFDALPRPEEALGLLGLTREMPLLVSGYRDAVRPEEIEVLRRFQREGAWVDLPWSPTLPEDLWGFDRSRLALSWHDFDSTPSDLGAQLARLRARSPAVSKMVPTARDFADLLALRDLLRSEAGRGDLCAFAMGSPGVPSRALALAWGSCAIYAAAPGSAPAAPAQLGIEELLSVYRPREAREEEPLYAVIGWPLHRTGSPTLHNRWLRELGLPGRFVPLPVRNLDTFFARAGEVPLRGVAVTVPHKAWALRRARRASRLASAVGACNTLLPDGGGWRAANTDPFGIRAALSEVPRGLRALLLGAGGAAAAAARVLARRGPLAVTARNPGEARALADRFGARATLWEQRASAPCDLLVNATPYGQEGDECPYPPEEIRARWVFDMVVREGETPLLRAAAAHGSVTIPGQVMLEAQARLQFRLFTGRSPRPRLRA